MTREEALSYAKAELKAAYNRAEKIGHKEKTRYIVVLEMAIKALEQEPRWISVSERLPEIHNYSNNYLVTLKRGGVHIAMFTECDGKSWWTYDDVVAWMPLPQQYEPQESEDRE